LEDLIASNASEQNAAIASIAATLKQLREDFGQQRTFTSPEIAACHQSAVRERLQQQRSAVGVPLSPNAGGMLE
jgi:hypothetical protein